MTETIEIFEARKAALREEGKKEGARMKTSLSIFINSSRKLCITILSLLFVVKPLRASNGISSWRPFGN
jgi:hypothetical protein